MRATHWCIHGCCLPRSQAPPSFLLLSSTVSDGKLGRALERVHLTGLPKKEEGRGVVLFSGPVSCHLQYKRNCFHNQPIHVCLYKQFLPSYPSESLGTRQGTALSYVPVQADDVSSFHPRTPARAWAQGKEQPCHVCLYKQMTSVVSTLVPQREPGGQVSLAEQNPPCFK